MIPWSITSLSGLDIAFYPEQSYGIFERLVKLVCIILTA